MSNLVAGKYNATPPTISDGGQEFLQIDENGNLKVAATITGGGDASSANQEAQIAIEEDIRDAVQAGATETTLGSVLTAVQDLGDGSSIDDIQTSLVSTTATQAKQDEQTALLTSMELKTRKGTVFMMTEHKKLTSIPSGGVNLRTLVPGKLPVFLTGTSTSGAGQIVYTLVDDDDSDPIPANFGPNGALQAVFGKIFDTSNPAILPIRVYFA